jgi:hypothetical protein
MNPYDSASEISQEPLAQKNRELAQNRQQTLLLFAWLAASFVTTVLLAAAFLFIREVAVFLVAILFVVVIGCLVPYLILRITKRREL